jgi:exodeoxyribonuclease VII large subunit
MLNVMRRRAPRIEILINPVRVQGTGAAAEIATAINQLSVPSQIWPALDLIVITRGGGSIEDLWEFNEEIVARAIAASAVPIVSAVGHEIDFTIADFVADLRAPTPSAAAELIVPDAAELERKVSELRSCLDRCLRKFATDARTRLSYVSERALGRELLKRVHDAQQQLDWIRDTLQKNVRQCAVASQQRLSSVATWLRAHSPRREIALRQNQYVEVQQRLTALAATNLDWVKQRLIRTDQVLRALAPEAILQRGYSITSDGHGNVIRSIAAVRRGMRLRTRVSDGEGVSMSAAASAVTVPSASPTFLPTVPWKTDSLPAAAIALFFRRMLASPPLR